MRKYWVLTILLGYLSPVLGQANYSLNSNLNQSIIQKKDYPNPTHHKTTTHDARFLGPFFGYTYIDDPAAHTLQVLAKLYPLKTADVPKEWPASLPMRQAHYVLVEFSNGEAMPAIRAPNGTLFSFTVEAGMLTFDIKHLYKNSEGNTRLGWNTFEIERQTAKYRLDYNLNQVLVQKKDCINPNFDHDTKNDTTVLGPSFDFTYVDEPQIKTLQELAKLYPLIKANLPDEWPTAYRLRTGRYVFVKFDTGHIIPAIQTPDGTLFSFLVEKGVLGLNIKHMYSRKRERYLGWMTADIAKNPK